jgi:hypothetical protein
MIVGRFVFVALDRHTDNVFEKIAVVHADKFRAGWYAVVDINRRIGI